MRQSNSSSNSRNTPKSTCFLPNQLRCYWALYILEAATQHIPARRHRETPITAFSMSSIIVCVSYIKRALTRSHLTGAVVPWLGDLQAWLHLAALQLCFAPLSISIFRARFISISQPVSPHSFSSKRRATARHFPTAVSQATSMRRLKRSLGAFSQSSPSKGAR